MDNGFVADLDVLPERVDGEQTSDPVPEQVGEDLDEREFSNRPEVAHVLPEETVDVIFRPAPVIARSRGENWFGKAAKSKQRFPGISVLGFREAKLGERLLGFFEPEELRVG